MESDVDFELTREDVQAGKALETAHQKVNDGELKRIVGGLRSGEITLDTFENDENSETKSDSVSTNELESQAELNVIGRLKEWATQDVYSPETIIIQYKA